MTIIEAQVDDILREYRSGRLTPPELVSFYLARIDLLDLRTETGPPYNCITCISPSVRHEARAARDDIARHGVVKPLHGIPVWVKDNIDVQGLPTTGGCLALEDGLAAADAPIVRNLRLAGAIVMGKVGMTELGIGSAEYSTMSGRIGNALDARNAPGGSSSGSAVAVSLNLGMLAIGVDDCSSITGPAAANACVGFRPTVGRVSRGGLLAYAESETTPGPIGRTVVDVVRAFDVLVDPSVSRSYGDFCRRASMRGARIGVLAGVDQLDFSNGVPRSVRRQFDERLDALAGAGATIVRGVTMEGFRWSRQALLEHYNSQVRSLGARAHRPRSPRQLYASDKIGPVIQVLARHPLFKFGPPVRLPNIWARSYPRVIRHNQELFDRTLSAARLDAVVAVTTSAPSRIATLAQLPHLTIPAGAVAADEEIEALGFVAGSVAPWGLSLLARTGADRELLAAGQAVEQIFGGRTVPAGVVSGDGVGDDVDIETFNEIKKRIAHRSYRRLELDEKRRRYTHPTAEEFRAIVRETLVEPLSFNRAIVKGHDHAHA